MPNLNRPDGFKVYGRLLRATEWEAGSAVYPGDCVTLASDGQVDTSTNSGDIMGVCLSYASAAGQKILVADHPDQLFVAQASSGAIDTQTDIGNTAVILATAANTVYKTSRQAVDTSTLYTSIASQVQILGLEPVSGEDGFGSNAKLVVRINSHQLRQNINGV